MSLVHVKITIDAPVQRVWDTVMDPERLGEWVTIHRAVRNVSKQPLEQGATMDQSRWGRSVREWVRNELAPRYRGRPDAAGPA